MLAYPRVCRSLISSLVSRCTSVILAIPLIEGGRTARASSSVSHSNVSQKVCTPAAQPNQDSCNTCIPQSTTVFKPRIHSGSECDTSIKKLGMGPSFELCPLPAGIPLCSARLPAPLKAFGAYCRPSALVNNLTNGKRSRGALFKTDAELSRRCPRSHLAPLWETRSAWPRCVVFPWPHPAHRGPSRPTRTASPG